jgi:Tfp pilus assembly protein PilW
MTTPLQKKFPHTDTHGFSLVEVMVYLAVTVLVTVVAVGTLLSLNVVLLRNETERALTHEASVALERIVREIRAAEGINAGLSTLDASMGRLALDSVSTTTVFSVSSGALQLEVNGTSLGALTSSRVTVEDVIFRRYVNSETELLRIALTLSVSNKAASSTRTFYTSAVPRGSYE